MTFINGPLPINGLFLEPIAKVYSSYSVSGKCCFIVVILHIFVKLLAFSDKGKIFTASKQKDDMPYTTK